MSTFDLIDYQSVIKLRNKLALKKPNRRISCKDLGQGDCEGWLWIKKCSLIKSKFVRRWCVLKNHNFYYYIHNENDRAEGIIHLPEFKVSPVENSVSKNFYFKIYNTKINFTFAIDTQTGFLKWLNKLQLSASSVNLDGLDGKISGFTASYTLNTDTIRSNTSDISSCSENESVEFVPYSESEDSDLGFEKTSFDTTCSSSDGQIKPLKMSAAETITNSNRESVDLSELAMNAIKRIVEIERCLREKRQFLSQINSFLKYPMTSEKIQEFWRNYNEKVSKS